MGDRTVNRQELANQIAAPVLLLFIIYVVAGRSFVLDAAGPTVALTVELLLVGLVLFVVASDVVSFIQRWRNRGEDDE